MSGQRGRYAGEVTIIRRSVNGENYVDTLALVSSKAASFPLDTDLEEGDLIEQRLPPANRKVYRATRVTYHNGAAYRHPRQPRLSRSRLGPYQLRQIEIVGMHPAVSRAAGALFASGDSAYDADYKTVGRANTLADAAPSSASCSTARGEARRWRGSEHGGPEACHVQRSAPVRR